MRTEVGKGEGTHVETGLDEDGLLALTGLLAVGDLLGALLQADLLLLLGLALVLVEETEELGGRVLVENLGELGDGGRDLQALVEDDLLALEADVFGPLDEAGEVRRGLDGHACIKRAAISAPVPSRALPHREAAKKTHRCRSSWASSRRGGSSSPPSPRASLPGRGRGRASFPC